MRRLARLVLAWVVPLTATGCSTYQVYPEVRGVVLSADAQYLGGATVHLLSGRELRNHRQATTDATGHFVIEEVRAKTPARGYPLATPPSYTGSPSMLEVCAPEYRTATFVFDKQSARFLPCDTPMSDWTFESPLPEPSSTDAGRPVRWQWHRRGVVWLSPVYLGRRGE